MSSLFNALSSLYEPDGAGASDPLRVTPGGLWHATPLAVLAAAVPHLVDQGLVPARQRLVLFDAGAGDGRVLSALALGLPPDVEATLLGLEIDPGLAATADAQTRRLGLHDGGEGRRPRVARGDYLAAADYATLGSSPSEIDLVFNYPDGNERRLLEWLRGHGGERTRLVILSPDHDPGLGASPHARTLVPADGAGNVQWRLSVFTMEPRGQ